ncbi:unnamed protein product [Parascedosporium putredinis]|uniref:HIT domain-containing protein n=1 Tax=Parascedosporium putredinis TaxID=1442378 RepID=A0A9P1GVQ1_9PEZI|nr:unnamed protein product [Parascedosporium putredinis]CAI7987935.1 unnamed protein product [Parascedosporium putredinis]
MASTSAPSLIHFGPFEVTKQVFLTTSHSFALVNLKPLLPGHVLVCPLRRHKRLTDLTTPEITDLFTTVQLVQRLLARHYFQPTPTETGAVIPAPPEEGRLGQGPSGDGDALYERMATEEGNVGGAHWDRVELEAKRPVGGGAFARIEDALRQSRSLEDMIREVEVYKKVLKDMGA